MTKFNLLSGDVRRELAEAVPPAFTGYIGRQLVAAIEVVAA